MKPLNTNLFKPLFAILAVALACVCMCGCGDDVSFEWEKTRRNAKVVGFVDDSLVMVGDYRFWLEVTDTWNGGHYEDTDAGNPRLCVYNYRVQEDGPRWCDSVSEQHSAEWFRGQMTDSTVWGGLLDKSFVLWKIGEKPHKMGLRTEFDGCSEKVGVNRIHEWIDGKFIALGVATINSKTFGNALQTLNYGNEFCQYAVLDTVAKLITYKRLSRDLEWIKECDDVRAWNDDVYCLWKNNEKTGFFLGINGQKKDSVYVVDVPNVSDLWNSFEFCFMGKMLYFGHNVNSLDYSNKKILVYPNIKATSAYNYVDVDGNNVNYEEVAK